MAMSLITTYATLQTAIAEYLGRTDQTENIKVFIQLAEADIARNLRLPAVVVGQTLDVDTDSKSLTALLGYPRSVRMDTDTYKHSLIMTNYATLADLRRVGSGVPYYAAFVDESLKFDVTVDSAYDIVVEYMPDLVPLSDGAPTNNTLLKSPDIYLFGALKEAEPFLEHDERNPMWSAKYQKAVADANDARERAEYGAGPVVPRLPIVLG